MSQIISDREGNQFEFITSEEAATRTDVAMEFKSTEEAETFVRRLAETAEGREQLRRLLAEVERRDDDNNDWMPYGIF